MNSPAADSLRIPGRIAKITPVAAHRWNVQVHQDLTALPSGSFNEEIPVRFYKDGKLLLGGAFATASGRIEGDLSALPSSLNLGQIGPDQTSRARIALAGSASTPCKVLSLSNTLGPWVTTRVSPKNDREIEVVITPPGKLAGQSFSGHLLIAVEGSYRSTLKILLFGAVKPPAQP